VRRRREFAADAVTLADARLARLREIAALDDAFEAGQIADEEYQARRAALKAELLKDET
jgi:hypothetical protein